MSNETTTLLALTDEPTTKALAADIESGFLTWRWDHLTSALVTAEGRVAVILFPAEYDEDDQADFEMADWYAERIAS